MGFTRREFLKGCCASTMLGAGGKPLMIFAGSAGATAVNSHDTIVQVFLRGGMDGLNFVVPVDGVDRGHYEQARPDLSIATSGAYGALPLTLANGAATGFGLHPSATGLRDLWNAQKLAIVHGAGLAEGTRSHFDAQLYMDLGTPGLKGGHSGWMTRAGDSQPGMTGTEDMPSLGVSSRQPVSLLGSTKALVMADPDDFALDSGAWAWQRTRDDSPAGLVGVNETLAALWAGKTALEASGQRTDRALKVIATQPYGDLPAGWPTGNFASQLWTVAQSIQFGLGLRYATLDLGGWDTHNGQGTAGSGWNYYQNKINELSAGLSAFYAALEASGHIGRVTVVVQSEFGRRVRANAAGGTDHGYGNPMLVLGGPVNGRRFYGTWSGLDPEVLSPYYGDVPVTTDYRRVISELLVRRMGNPDLGRIFPGYSGYSPLGIVQGTDLAITSGLHPSAMMKPSSQPAIRRAVTLRQREDDALERFWKFLQFLMSRV